MIVALEDEPYPKSPIGKSMAIKLEDWLDLARLLPDAKLDIRDVGALAAERPQIVEAFDTWKNLLGEDTIPSRNEHDYLDDIRAYWPAVAASGIPAIPVYPIGTDPDEYPVFIRGRSSSFTRRRITCAEELQPYVANKDIVIRPYLDILPCWRRHSVQKELRVHLVDGKVSCVEFLFPSWAAQRPTESELHAGREWTQSVASKVTEWSDHLGNVMNCRWFTADFAETAEGTLLIEVNPGWCAGVTSPVSARAIHLSILTRIFGYDVLHAHCLAPEPNVPLVRKP